MFLGTSNAHLDWWDNPYIEVNIYDVDEEWVPKIAEGVKLRKCQKSDLTKFLSDTASNYYPNSLCFRDVSKVHLNRNWFGEKYNNLIISIDACRNTTENPIKCA